MIAAGKVLGCARLQRSVLGSSLPRSRRDAAGEVKSKILGYDVIIRVMCGRARCTLRPDDFSRACHLSSRPVRHLDMDRYRPSYNVAPGFNVPVIRRDDDGFVLHCMKWGLIPSFTNKTEKPDYFRMFNARSESLREKASFRRLLPTNRCLVSVEGFYEWKKDGQKKQPYYIHFNDDRPLVFAALFDSWKNSEEVIYTFTIVTTSSSSALEWLHDRMPVILGDKESTDLWLSDSLPSDLDKIFKPYDESDLVWYPVTPAMGKLSCNGPECIKKVKAEEIRSISHFFSTKVSRLPEPELEKTTIKKEILEAGQPKCIKEEPEGHSKFEDTRVKDESIEAGHRKFVNEEPEPQYDYHESVTAEDENDLKGDVSTLLSKGVSPVKRGYEEFPTAAKPFAKETNRQHKSPDRKKRKGPADTQSTLFSYFGRS
ncbi:embryonic stem cell-specific 5-hydroxymethylcytosine-binding protein-like [Dorcoceras hygrometricum]|uniref:Embryonic stem cell-specific 5-hydroxymethylcytosine-binding protein-like n=1 Tax=Dorcoceras hygrometricum TaxID=472368 RepID=A0A2Z7CIM4_9LAMI|nr:embryonic stem cell-specific 5-hydroxymethylcytosine-binding protein-like [Dorcoceras hygrometricum]